MNSWNQYLSNHGARHSATEPDRVGDFGRALTPSDLSAGFVAAITGHGVIAVSGEEGASFLHKQLTNDVEHLGDTDVRLAAFCTPKGRMQASFLMWRNSDAVMLQLPRELQPAIQKRLSMFVMRSKAQLVDATPECMIGVGGVKAPAALGQLFGELPPTQYSKRDCALGTLIRLGDALGAPRFQWLTASESAQAAWPALAAALAVGGDDAWNLSAIHAGVPEITLKTQEQFVPQMVNFELLGGVNFKKGCYPGQEIVARSQYLGKLKRRTMLAGIAAIAQAGDEVFAVADPEQPCGMVVNAAPNGAGGTDVLVEMKLAALEQADVRLGSAHGAPLRFMPMPYPLDALEL